MPAAHYDFNVDQGSTFKMTLDLYDSANALVDLSNYSAEMQVRRSYTDDKMVCQLTSNWPYGCLGPGASGEFKKGEGVFGYTGGIVLNYQGSTGKILLEIDNKTSYWGFKGPRLFYDLKLTNNADLSVSTIIRGKVRTSPTLINTNRSGIDYKPFVVDRRPFYNLDFAVGNKGIDDWRMTSDDTQQTNPDATSGVISDPQDAARTAVEVTMQREYERGFRRFNLRTPMGARTGVTGGNALPSASWSAGDPNLGTWSDLTNITTVKSGGPIFEYPFTTTGIRMSLDETAATADRQQSFINFLKPWIDSKKTAGDPVQVYIYDGYQLAFHDTAQTDPAKGNLAMVGINDSNWSGDAVLLFPLPDFSKSSHVEFRENEVIPWRDQVGISGFIVDAASNAGDTAGNQGVARAPGYFDFYRTRGLDVIGEAVPMIIGDGGTYDLNPDLYKMTPYVGYGGGTADGITGNFWGNRNWRTILPSITDSEIHMVVQWGWQGATGGINHEYWNGTTYDWAGITAEIKQAHDNGFIVDAGFGPYLSSNSPAEEVKRSIVLDYISELGSL